MNCLHTEGLELFASDGWLLMLSGGWSSGCTAEGLGADLSALDSKSSVNALARFCVVEFEEWRAGCSDPGRDCACPVWKGSHWSVLVLTSCPNTQHHIRNCTLVCCFIWNYVCGSVCVCMYTCMPLHVQDEGPHTLTAEKPLKPGRSAPVPGNKLWRLLYFLLVSPMSILLWLS